LETSEARQTGRYREENHPVSSTHTRRQVAPDDPGPGEGRTGGGPDRPPRRWGRRRTWSVQVPRGVRSFDPADPSHAGPTVAV